MFVVLSLNWSRRRNVHSFIIHHCLSCAASQGWSLYLLTLSKGGATTQTQIHTCRQFRAQCCIQKCGRKPESLEGAHADLGRTCKPGLVQIMCRETLNELLLHQADGSVQHLNICMKLDTGEHEGKMFNKQSQHSSWHMFFIPAAHYDVEVSQSHGLASSN